MVQLCTGSDGQRASSVVVNCYVGKQVEQGEAAHVSASDSTGCKATGGPCQEYRCPPTDHAQRMSAPKIVTMPQKASCADVWTKFVGKCQMCLQDVARREELTGVQKNVNTEHYSTVNQSQIKSTGEDSSKGPQNIQS